ncbi:FtsQ-type POTRA domain-containing protein [Saccharothrix sp. S26]|uniref:cell division protein FtsQ/DivIB n=1 Tax=Saccharothrix sp. S26 TaxID=2907215 RepID=UPI001F24DB1B|nr:FtsQ-type POTRA domain-containing protein [Saccharothrix sp. S26]MCE6993784.1 FtsQ-type POTRA domain-containing protein [Saccharothrix sp. S26]
MSTQAARRRPGAANAGSRPAARRRPSSRRPSRAQAYRRKVVRRRVGAVLVMLVVTVVVCTVWFTPALGVREVQVRGILDLTADEVRAAAAVEPGTPLVRLDVDAVAGRVRELPRVAGVEVERVLPGTVRLTVDEREPVAVIKAPEGAHLVDVTGKDYATVVQPPVGLPELKVTPDAVAAAVAVLTQLPESLRKDVSTVTADSPSDVRLALGGGREARWGSSDDTARKAAVLEVLLTRKGSVFDVSSPELPTVS